MKSESNAVSRFERKVLSNYCFGFSIFYSNIRNEKTFSQELINFEPKDWYNEFIAGANFDSRWSEKKDYCNLTFHQTKVKFFINYSPNICKFAPKNPKLRQIIAIPIEQVPPFWNFKNTFCFLVDFCTIGNITITRLKNEKTAIARLHFSLLILCSNDLLWVFI